VRLKIVLEASDEGGYTAIDRRIRTRRMAGRQAARQPYPAAEARRAKNTVETFIALA
jgi:hypothetical protein